MDDLRDCSSFGWIVVCFISLATNALFTVLGIVAIVKVRQGQNTKRKDTHTKVRPRRIDYKELYELPPPPIPPRNY